MQRHGPNGRRSSAAASRGARSEAEDPRLSKPLFDLSTYSDAQRARRRRRRHRPHDVDARVRPSKMPSRHLEIDYAEHAIALKLERKREEAVVNNQRENYSFAFSRVLDMRADTSVRSVYSSGYAPPGDSSARRGTTAPSCVRPDRHRQDLHDHRRRTSATSTAGSSRARSRTSSARRAAQRVQRTSCGAQSPAARNCGEFADGPHPTTGSAISYLEIYLEAGYDLLDPSHETKGLEDLPKVTMQEDDDSRIHLRNLSAQVARSEEEALNERSSWATPTA